MSNKIKLANDIQKFLREAQNDKEKKYGAVAIDREVLDYFGGDLPALYSKNYLEDDRVKMIDLSDIPVYLDALEQIKQKEYAEMIKNLEV